MRILYFSYDGILEPLGQSQVLRYLEQLSTKHEIYLVSYEKQEDWRDNAKRETLRAYMVEVGIKWFPLRYHKTPSGLATAFDIFQGLLISSWIVAKHRIQIVHARSYVPSVVALILKKIFAVKFIFDMRGFWADERVDGGLWPRDGRMYRVSKWFEKHFLLSADRVVSLTKVAVEEMKTFSYLQGRLPKFELISTCADLNLFKPANINSEKEIKRHSFTLGYVGSVGVWYLFDETLKCFKELLLKIPDAQFHIYNIGGHDYIHERIAAMGIPTESIKIRSADHVGIAKAMQHIDAGIFFYKPMYSKLATAPTKLGEFLGCGVPCMGNTNVGDMTDILEAEHVGVALSSFDETSIRTGIEKLLLLTQKNDIKLRCRDVALRYFSLDSGVQEYDRIYSELLDG